MGRAILRIAIILLTVLLSGALVNASQPAEWPTAHRTWERTGYIDINLPNKLELAWEFQPGPAPPDIEKFRAASLSPAVAHNKVYFVLSGDNLLYALHADNGIVAWSKRIDKISFPWLSSPTVENGKLYVGSNTSLYAFDAETGEFYWRFQVPEEGFVSKTVQGAPAVVGGRVYFGSWNGYVYALDAANGSFVWKFNAKGHVFTNPSAADGMVYFGTGAGVYEDGAYTGNRVYALYAENGRMKWSTALSDLGGKGELASMLVVVDNRIYMGGGWPLDRGVYCLNAENGSLIWRFQTEGSPFVSPAVAHGKVFITISNAIYAIKADDGSLLWVTLIEGGLELSPVVIGDKVIVGEIYLLDENGSITWHENFFAGPESTPAAAYGKVFVTGKYGRVYAFRGVKPPETQAATWPIPLAVSMVAIAGILSVLLVAKRRMKSMLPKGLQLRSNWCWRVVTAGLVPSLEPP